MCNVGFNLLGFVGSPGIYMYIFWRQCLNQLISSKKLDSSFLLQLYHSPLGHCVITDRSTQGRSDTYAKECVS